MIKLKPTLSISRNNSLFFQKEDFKYNIDNSLKYNICSISKTLSSFLCLYLLHKHKIDINSRISKFTSFKYDITIYQLLCHCSGIKNVENEDTVLYNLNNNLILDFDKNIVFNDNKSFEYNSYNYFILKELLENISNLNINELVKELVYFLELDIEPPVLIEGKNITNVAFPFASDEVTYKFSLDFFSKQRNLSGGFFSDSLNLDIFLTSFLTKFFKINPNLFNYIKKFNTNNYSLGLFQYKGPDNLILWGHHGDSFGYCSLYVFNPNNNNSLCILLNIKDIDFLTKTFIWSFENKLI